VVDFDRDSKIQELNWGITNFDNIFSALLTIFQCITLEGWTQIMYMIQDAYSYYFAAIYFSLCIIICSYFLLNLTVAVMLDNFSIMQNTSEKLKKHYEKLFGEKNIDVDKKRKELNQKRNISFIKS